MEEGGEAGGGGWVRDEGGEGGIGSVRHRDVPVIIFFVPPVF